MVGDGGSGSPASSIRLLLPVYYDLIARNLCICGCCWPDGALLKDVGNSVGVFDHGWSHPTDPVLFHQVQLLDGEVGQGPLRSRLDAGKLGEGIGCRRSDSVYPEDPAYGHTGRRDPETPAGVCPPVWPARLHWILAGVGGKRVFDLFEFARPKALSR